MQWLVTLLLSIRGKLWFKLFYSGFNLCILLSFILESHPNTDALFQLVKGQILMNYSPCQQDTEEQHLILVIFIDSNQIMEEQINVQILTA